jgi:ATP-dependent Clp protease adaptor protein ClpS
MLRVHHSGQAVVGVYSLDIAATKVQKATQMADEAGFPLRIVLLPE